jgi:hypothetical protein
MGIMGERRLEAVVVGPGAPGFLKIALGRDDRRFVADVPADRLPASLRPPNSRFVGVVEGRDLIRVESAGRAWLDIQDRMRAVLNASWDPIGVAEDVDDEYDGYIGGILSLLRNDASVDVIAEHLSRIEVELMGLAGSPLTQLREVAVRLRQLQLPVVGDPNSAA